MLILRRLWLSIWVIIVEQGILYPYVPAAHSWLSGHMYLGGIWGSVMHCVVFLHPKLRKIDAVLITLKLITLTLQRLRRAVSAH